MVTNQDGLGTAVAIRAAASSRRSGFMLELFASQGVEFEAVFICPHFAHEGCDCRKPLHRAGARLPARTATSICARSAVIGDRDTDLEFARNLGMRGLRVRRDGSAEETWPADRARRCSRAARDVERAHAGDRDHGRASTRRDARRVRIAHRHRLLRSHARAARQARRLRARRSRCAGDLHIDEHHTVEDCALALGEALRQRARRQGRHRPLRLPAGDGRGARRRWRSISPAAPTSVFEGSFGREQDRRPADGAGAALLPLARREPRRRAAHDASRREHAPHDRGLLQGRGPRAATGAPARGSRAAEHQGGAVSDDVVIIDSGGANLASLQFALERLGARASVTQRCRRAIAAAPRVLLPGVGCARPMRCSGCAPAVSIELHAAARAAACSASASACSCCSSTRRKATTPCLGVLSGTRASGSPRSRACRCRTWAGTRSSSRTGDPLLEGVELRATTSTSCTATPRRCRRRRSRPSATASRCHAVVRRGNFCGTQFHPERSAAAGRARCSRNFLRL